MPQQSRPGHVFSRVFHAHPGRAVWIFLNVGVALTLTELGVFGFLDAVLGFYSDVAIARIGAVVADLVINKPILKLSPDYIEFKRAHLRSVNPVGFGAMVVSIMAFFGLFGSLLAAFSPYLALLIAFVLSPVLCVATKAATTSPGPTSWTRRWRTRPAPSRRSC